MTAIRGMTGPASRCWWPGRHRPFDTILTRANGSTDAVSPLLFSHYTATSCLGHGLDATLAALRALRGGLAPCDFSDIELNTYIGEVSQVDQTALPAALAEFD